jgi:hypothetical protein
MDRHGRDAVEGDRLPRRVHVRLPLVRAVIARAARRRPVIPRMFWYMSVLGADDAESTSLFSAKADSVGVLQNLFPTFTRIYSSTSTSSTAAGTSAGTGA